MNRYRITNITDKLGKRDINYNRTLVISFVDEMIPKTISLRPGDVMYFSGDQLPLSVHRFRIKNLVSVNEITENEFRDIQTKNTKNKKKIEGEDSITTTTTTKKYKTKKYTNKSSTTTKRSSSNKSTSTKKGENTTTTTEKEDSEE